MNDDINKEPISDGYAYSYFEDYDSDRTYRYTTLHTPNGRSYPVSEKRNGPLHMIVAYHKIYNEIPVL